MPGKIKGLFRWCQKVTKDFEGIEVKDMTSSWKNGLAFCALISRFRPDLINFYSLSPDNVYENNDLAFSIMEKEYGIIKMLDPEDMVAMETPDRYSIATYLSEFYDCFKDQPMYDPPEPPPVKLASSESTLARSKVEINGKNKDENPVMKETSIAETAGSKGSSEGRHHNLHNDKTNPSISNNTGGGVIETVQASQSLLEETKSEIQTSKDKSDVIKTCESEDDDDIDDLYNESIDILEDDSVNTDLSSQNKEETEVDTAVEGNVSYREICNSEIEDIKQSKKSAILQAVVSAGITAVAATTVGDKTDFDGESFLHKDGEATECELSDKTEDDSEMSKSDKDNTSKPVPEIINSQSDKLNLDVKDITNNSIDAETSKNCKDSDPVSVTNESFEKVSPEDTAEALNIELNKGDLEIVNINVVEELQLQNTEVNTDSESTSTESEKETEELAAVENLAAEFVKNIFEEVKSNPEMLKEITEGLPSIVKEVETDLEMQNQDETNEGSEHPSIEIQQEDKISNEIELAIKKLHNTNIASSSSESFSNSEKGLKDPSSDVMSIENIHNKRAERKSSDSSSSSSSSSSSESSDKGSESEEEPPPLPSVAPPTLFMELKDDIVAAADQVACEPVEESDLLTESIDKKLEIVANPCSEIIKNEVPCKKSPLPNNEVKQMEQADIEECVVELVPTKIDLKANESFEEEEMIVKDVDVTQNSVPCKNEDIVKVNLGENDNDEPSKDSTDRETEILSQVIPDSKHSLLVSEDNPERLIASPVIPDEVKLDWSTKSSIQANVDATENMPLEENKAEAITNDYKDKLKNAAIMSKKMLEKMNLQLLNTAKDDKSNENVTKDVNCKPEPAQTDLQNDENTQDETNLNTFAEVDTDLLKRAALMSKQMAEKVTSRLSEDGNIEKKPDESMDNCIDETCDQLDIPKSNNADLTTPPSPAPLDVDEAKMKRMAMFRQLQNSTRPTKKKLEDIETEEPEIENKDPSSSFRDKMKMWNRKSSTNIEPDRKDLDENSKRKNRRSLIISPFLSSSPSPTNDDQRHMKKLQDALPDKPAPGSVAEYIRKMSQTKLPVSSNISPVTAKPVNAEEGSVMKRDLNQSTTFTERKPLWRRSVDIVPVTSQELSVDKIESNHQATDLQERDPLLRRSVDVTPSVVFSSKPLMRRATQERKLAIRPMSVDLKYKIDAEEKEQQNTKAPIPPPRPHRKSPGKINIDISPKKSPGRVNIDIKPLEKKLAVSDEEKKETEEKETLKRQDSLKRRQSPRRSLSLSSPTRPEVVSKKPEERVRNIWQEPNKKPPSPKVKRRDSFEVKIRPVSLQLSTEEKEEAKKEKELERKNSLKSPSSRPPTPTKNTHKLPVSVKPVSAQEPSETNHQEEETKSKIIRRNSSLKDGRKSLLSIVGNMAHSKNKVNERNLKEDIIVPASQKVVEASQKVDSGIPKSSSTPKVTSPVLDINKMGESVSVVSKKPGSKVLNYVQSCLQQKVKPKSFQEKVAESKISPNSCEDDIEKMIIQVDEKKLEAAVPEKQRNNEQVTVITEPKLEDKDISNKKGVQAESEIIEQKPQMDFKKNRDDSIRKCNSIFGSSKIMKQPQQNVAHDLNESMNLSETIEETKVDVKGSDKKEKDSSSSSSSSSSSNSSAMSSPTSKRKKNVLSEKEIREKLMDYKQTSDENDTVEISYPLPEKSTVHAVDPEPVVPESESLQVIAKEILAKDTVALEMNNDKDIDIEAKNDDKNYKTSEDSSSEDENDIHGLNKSSSSASSAEIEKTELKEGLKTIIKELEQEMEGNIKSDEEENDNSEMCSIDMPKDTQRKPSTDSYTSSASAKYDEKKLKPNSSDTSSSSDDEEDVNDKKKKKRVRSSSSSNSDTSQSDTDEKNNNMEKNADIPEVSLDEQGRKLSASNDETSDGDKSPKFSEDINNTPLQTGEETSDNKVSNQTLEIIEAEVTQIVACEPEGVVKTDIQPEDLKSTDQTSASSEDNEEDKTEKKNKEERKDRTENSSSSSESDHSDTDIGTDNDKKDKYQVPQITTELPLKNDMGKTDVKQSEQRKTSSSSDTSTESVDTKPHSDGKDNENVNSVQLIDTEDVLPSNTDLDIYTTDNVVKETEKDESSTHTSDNNSNTSFEPSTQLKEQQPEDIKSTDQTSSSSEEDENDKDEKKKKKKKKKKDKTENSSSSSGSDHTDTDNDNAKKDKHQVLQVTAELPIKSDIEKTEDVKQGEQRKTSSSSDTLTESVDATSHCSGEPDNENFNSVQLTDAEYILPSNADLDINTTDNVVKESEKVESSTHTSDDNGSTSSFEPSIQLKEQQPEDIKSTDQTSSSSEEDEDDKTGKNKKKKKKDKTENSSSSSESDHTDKDDDNDNDKKDEERKLSSDSDTSTKSVDTKLHCSDEIVKQEPDSEILKTDHQVIDTEDKTLPNAELDKNTSSSSENDVDDKTDKKKKKKKKKKDKTDDTSSSSSESHHSDTDDNDDDKKLKKIDETVSQIEPGLSDITENDTKDGEQSEQQRKNSSSDSHQSDLNDVNEEYKCIIEVNTEPPLSYNTPDVVNNTNINDIPCREDTRNANKDELESCYSISTVDDEDKDNRRKSEQFEDPIVDFRQRESLSSSSSSSSSNESEAGVKKRSSAESTSEANLSIDLESPAVGLESMKVQSESDSSNQKKKRVKQISGSSSSVSTKSSNSSSSSSSDSGEEIEAETEHDDVTKEHGADDEKQKSPEISLIPEAHVIFDSKQEASDREYHADSESSDSEVDDCNPIPMGVSISYVDIPDLIIDPGLKYIPKTTADMTTIIPDTNEMKNITVDIPDVARVSSVKGTMNDIETCVRTTVIDSSSSDSKSGQSDDGSSSDSSGKQDKINEIKDNDKLHLEMKVITTKERNSSESHSDVINESEDDEDGNENTEQIREKIDIASSASDSDKRSKKSILAQLKQIITSRSSSDDDIKIKPEIKKVGKEEKKHSSMSSSSSSEDEICDDKIKPETGKEGKKEEKHSSPSSSSSSDDEICGDNIKPEAQKVKKMKKKHSSLSSSSFSEDDICGDKIKPETEKEGKKEEKHSSPSSSSSSEDEMCGDKIKLEAEKEGKKEKKHSSLSSSSSSEDEMCGDKIKLEAEKEGKKEEKHSSTSSDDEICGDNIKPEAQKVRKKEKKHSSLASSSSSEDDICGDKIKPETEKGEKKEEKHSSASSSSSSEDEMCGDKIKPETEKEGKKEEKHSSPSSLSSSEDEMFGDKIKPETEKLEKHSSPSSTSCSDDEICRDKTKPKTEKEGKKEEKHSSTSSSSSSDDEICRDKTKPKTEKEGKKEEKHSSPSSSSCSEDEICGDKSKSETEKEGKKEEKHSSPSSFSSSEDEMCGDKIKLEAEKEGKKEKKHSSPSSSSSSEDEMCGDKIKLEAEKEGKKEEKHSSTSSDDEICGDNIKPEAQKVRKKEKKHSSLASSSSSEDDICGDKIKPETEKGEKKEEKHSSASSSSSSEDEMCGDKIKPETEKEGKKEEKHSSPSSLSSSEDEMSGDKIKPETEKFEKHSSPSSTSCSDDEICRDKTKPKTEKEGKKEEKHSSTSSSSSSDDEICRDKTKPKTEKEGKKEEKHSSPSSSSCSEDEICGDKSKPETEKEGKKEEKHSSPQSSSSSEDEICGDKIKPETEKEGKKEEKHSSPSSSSSSEDEMCSDKIKLETEKEEKHSSTSSSSSSEDEICSDKIKLEAEKGGKKEEKHSSTSSSSSSEDEICSDKIKPETEKEGKKEEKHNLASNASSSEDEIESKVNKTKPEISKESKNDNDKNEIIYQPTSLKADTKIYLSKESHDQVKPATLRRNSMSISSSDDESGNVKNMFELEICKLKSDDEDKMSASRKSSVSSSSGSDSSKSGSSSSSSSDEDKLNEEDGLLKTVIEDSLPFKAPILENVIKSTSMEDDDNNSENDIDSADDLYTDYQNEQNEEPQYILPECNVIYTDFDDKRLTTTDFSYKLSNVDPKHSPIDIQVFVIPDGPIESVFPPKMKEPAFALPECGDVKPLFEMEGDVIIPSDPVIFDPILNEEVILYDETDIHIDKEGIELSDIVVEADETRTSESEDELLKNIITESELNLPNIKRRKSSTSSSSSSSSSDEENIKVELGNDRKDKLIRNNDDELKTKEVSEIKASNSSNDDEDNKDNTIENDIEIKSSSSDSSSSSESNNDEKINTGKKVKDWDIKDLINTETPIQVKTDLKDETESRVKGKTRKFDKQKKSRSSSSSSSDSGKNDKTMSDDIETKIDKIKTEVPELVKIGLKDSKHKKKKHTVGKQWNSRSSSSSSSTSSSSSDSDAENKSNNVIDLPKIDMSVDNVDDKSVVESAIKPEVSDHVEAVNDVPISIDGVRNEIKGTPLAKVESQIIPSLNFGADFDIPQVDAGSRQEQETDQSQFMIGREKDPSKSEVARLIQQSLEIDRKREELRRQEQERLAELQDQFKPRDEVLEHEHLRHISESTSSHDGRDDNAELDESSIEDEVEEQEMSEDLLAGDATPMSMPSGADTDNSVSSPEDGSKPVVEVFDLQESSGEDISPDMESQALFVKLKEAQCKNAVLEAELTKLKAKVIVLENTEGQKRQYEKKCEEMATRLRETEKSLTNARREINHYQDMMEGSQGQYIGLEKKMKGEFTALEKKYHKAKKLIKEYQQREKDFIAERESLLQQQTEKDQQYNALVKSLKDRIFQLEGELREAQTAAGLPVLLPPQEQPQRPESAIVPSVISPVKSTPFVHDSGSPLMSPLGDKSSVSSESDVSSAEPISPVNEEELKLESSVTFESVPVTQLLDTSINKSRAQVANSSRRPPTKQRTKSQDSEELMDAAVSENKQDESGLETWIRHDSDNTVKKSDVKKRKAQQQQASDSKIPPPVSEAPAPVPETTPMVTEAPPTVENVPPPPPPPSNPPPSLTESDTSEASRERNTRKNGGSSSVNKSGRHNSRVRKNSESEDSSSTISQTSYDPSKPEFRGIGSEIPGLDNVSTGTGGTNETHESESSSIAAKKSKGIFPKLPFKKFGGGDKDKGGVMLVSSRSLNTDDTASNDGGITLISKKKIDTGLDFDGASTISDTSSGYMVGEMEQSSYNFSGTPANEEHPSQTGHHSQNQIQSCTIAEWNNEHVRHWLMGIEMEKYASLFTEKSITGLQLVALDASKLKALGITSTKDRDIFKKKLRELKVVLDKERKQMERERKQMEKEQRAREKEQKKLLKKK